jgi:methyl-accepting chemotaxis protein
MNLNEALSAHADWKVKLRSAIFQKSTLDAVSLGRDDCCAFGKWLRGEARIKYGSQEVYRECIESHTAFHRMAGKIATLINAGKYEEAETALGAPDYSSATMKVGVAIKRLQKDMAA